MFERSAFVKMVINKLTSGIRKIQTLRKKDIN